MGGAPPDRMRARDFVRGNPGQPDMRPVPLDGLNQIIGLALGAPEFQRR